MVGWLDELARTSKKAVVVQWRHYPDLFLEKIMKLTKNLTEDSTCTG
jgi:hypothetical protein